MDNNDQILQIITKMLEMLRVEVTGVEKEVDQKTGSVRYTVKTPESALLIGEHGARLSALNHLVKKIIEKEYKDERQNFHIDINDYHKKQLDELRAKAHILAERARYFKSAVEMDPMTAYERMIIHSEFAESPDIVTESTGIGNGRRIILRYSETKKSAP